MHCYFSQCKSTKISRIESIINFKSLQYSPCACLRNMLKKVTLVIGNLEMAYFSLFLDAFPHRPKTLWTENCQATYKVCSETIETCILSCSLWCRHMKFTMKYNCPRKVILIHSFGLAASSFLLLLP